MLDVLLTRCDGNRDASPRVFWEAMLPFLMADERPARKVFVIALMNVAIMIAEVLGTALWYGMTGIDIIDYDNTRAHLGEFAIMHAASSRLDDSAVRRAAPRSTTASLRDR